MKYFILLIFAIMIGGSLISQDITEYNLTDVGANTLQIGSIFNGNASGPVLQDNSTVTLFVPTALAPDTYTSLQGGSWGQGILIDEATLVAQCGVSATGLQMLTVVTNGSADLGAITTSVEEPLVTILFTGSTSEPIVGLDPFGGDPLSACVVALGGDNTADIDLDGNGGSDAVGYEDIPISPDTPLPAEMDYFSAKSHQNDGILDWRTLSELDVSLFEIQRSSNLLHWGKVSNVDAVGYSLLPITYQYTDKNASRYAAVDGSLYYRLKVLDISGAFEFTEIRRVQFENSRDNRFVVLPNPVKSNFSVLLHPHQTGTSKMLEIRDQSGQLIRKEQLDSSLEISLDVEELGLVQGVYILGLVVNDVLVETSRMVVIK